MKLRRFLISIVVLSAFPFAGCSSADDGTEDPTGQGEERRVSLGKADSLAGKCSLNGVSYCGGKSKNKCWCDAACAQYGDCCADYKTSCGGGSATECKTTADCPSGQYCQAQDGCNTPGVCKPKPTGVICAQVITKYCTCEGETKVSNNGCIFDRFAHKGECEQKQMCGGIASLPCPDGMQCVDDPDDSCDPANGGADCSGMCVAQQGCSPVMCELYCAYGFKKDANGCEICSCNPAPGNSCEGKCGGPSADKSCYCDSSCKSYGDCCADYDKYCGVRTPASGACVKNSNDACSSDADCKGGGCGGELCYNPAVSSGISTCECTAPQNVKGCGCVSGKCTWWN